MTSPQDPALGDTDASSATDRIVGGAVGGLRTLGIGAVRRYNRLTTRTDASDVREDRGPVLFVANHGFGGIFDLNVFATLAALDDLGLGRPVTILTHQLAWTVGVGRLIEPLGARPAGRDATRAAFAAGRHVLVFPGGDVEAGKAFRDRNRIVFNGRHGFARMALEAGVPVVPVVTAGAGESVYVVTDGRRIARALRTDRLFRLKALPVSLSVPWGLSVGAVGLLPYLPLPTKLDTTVLPTMRHADGESHHGFAERVQDAMQTELSRLTRRRTPLRG